MKGSKPHSRLYALTGCIGSGKSEVCRIFEHLGAAIINADMLAREIVVPGSDGLQEVLDAFGAGVANHDGSLNRHALGKLVFSDAHARLRLEQITHPRIQALFRERLAALRQKDPGALVIYEVPLLFESNNHYPEFDGVIVVSAPAEICIKRAHARNPELSEHEIQRRLAAQIPIEEKAQRADFVIMNDGTKDALRHQVARIFLSLQQ